MEYEDLSKKNYAMEVERENNYKRFFKEYDKNMSERLSTHIKSVTEAKIEKQQKLDEIEEKNAKEYQDWLAEKEYKEKQERMKQMKEINDANRLAYNKIDRERTEKKEMYNHMVEQRKKEEEDYKAFQQKQLEEDEERRKLYRQALENQKGYKDYNKKNLGQMTHMEKKLNNNDLKTFKQKKKEYEGMIPGINNLQSVGSKPLLRTANDDLYEQSKNPSSLMTNDLRGSLKDLRGAVKPLEDFSVTKSPSKQARYDPITNPIPFVNQNPYIVHEKKLIGGDAPSNLLNHSQRRSQRSLLSATAEKNILI